MTSSSPRKRQVEVDLNLLYSVEEEGEGEGLTSAEIAEKLGCGVAKARKVIRKAMEAGKCRPSCKYVKTITGYKQRYVTYVFEEQEQLK